MNDQDQNTVVLDDEGNPVDELALLKERAKDLGIRFSPNIGVDALRKRVNDKINGDDDDGAGDETPAAATPQEKPAVKKDADYTTEELRSMPKVAREAILRRRIRAEKMAMVRCRIANLDPSKNDLQGEIFTVLNKYVGKVSKFIPYDDKGNDYHIPKVLFDLLAGKEFLQKRVKKDPKGQEYVETKWVKEFSLEVRTQLTPTELAELELAQKAAERTE